jgi:serine/threonine protein kinase
MLDHPNVVRFEDCFEDEENVYMVLDLCEHGVSTATLVILSCTDVSLLPSYDVIVELPLTRPPRQRL